jgi:hypothetical protein
VKNGEKMPVITVGFRKLHAERKDNGKGPLKIINNVSIKDVAKTELALGTSKQNALRASFTFVTKYETNIAEIDIEGDVIYLTSNDKIESILKDWKKDKKLPKEVMTEIVNNLLTRCNIEAILLSREMNLPSPIALPKVAAK